jgi:hypothetical protein
MNKTIAFDGGLAAFIQAKGGTCAFASFNRILAIAIEKVNNKAVTDGYAKPNDAQYIAALANILNPYV